MISEWVTGSLELPLYTTLDLNEARMVDPNISTSTAVGFFETGLPCARRDHQNPVLTTWDIIMKSPKMTTPRQED